MFLFFIVNVNEKNAVQQLVEFLNAVDYNLEKAQELILAHYRLKMQIADILFNQRDPFHSDVQNVWTVM